MNIKSIIGDFVFQCLSRTSPKLYIEVLYKRYFHKSIDWKHPRNVDEKINWLKLYSDTSKWTELADKYKVREYVAQQGFGDMLVKLYGKWDKADNIEWEKLPERFVMKANNGSGDILICQDKSKIDTKFHVKKFNSVLKMKFGYLKVEPHYNKIPPCIIAEELLDHTKQSLPEQALIDYKIWAFNGKAEYIMTCSNRKSDSVDLGVYDKAWNFHPEFSVATLRYHVSEKQIPRPQSLERMLEVASALSKGFPQVRVDFYEVDGKPYFGEMTFTSCAGFHEYYTDEFKKILGEKIKLPEKK